ncbi:sarcoplasmic reticulum histidine-rich calcium-binding protein [Aplysia californica]|uniref:Sarcoplasmic reticulum histidine-rich calcium-binding protein n=1 Tax=Aplysia californica TaxID=6500 RepID=A0ABM1A8L3_APLCA|nr:sarcoplasmic reticulum histidine-rich calcium-binding protein [Aplysia californica]
MKHNQHLSSTVPFNTLKIQPGHGSTHHTQAQLSRSTHSGSPQRIQKEKTILPGDSGADKAASQARVVSPVELELGGLIYAPPPMSTALPELQKQQMSAGEEAREGGGGGEEEGEEDHVVSIVMGDDNMDVHEDKFYDARQDEGVALTDNNNDDDNENGDDNKGSRRVRIAGDKDKDKENHDVDDDDDDDDHVGSVSENGDIDDTTPKQPKGRHQTEENKEDDDDDDDDETLDDEGFPLDPYSYVHPPPTTHTSFARYEKFLQRSYEDLLTVHAPHDDSSSVVSDVCSPRPDLRHQPALHQSQHASPAPTLPADGLSKLRATMPKFSSRAAAYSSFRHSHPTTAATDHAPREAGTTTTLMVAPPRERQMSYSDWLGAGYYTDDYRDDRPVGVGGTHGRQEARHAELEEREEEREEEKEELEVTGHGVTEQEVTPEEGKGEEETAPEGKGGDEETGQTDGVSTQIS